MHKVAADAGGPDRLYAQNHGGVYRTDDAGRRWTSIAAGLPADFGFPVLAHPGRPGVAWVVPLVADEHRLPPDGRLRLHRTEDAGESWREVGRRPSGPVLDRRAPRRRLRAGARPGRAGRAGRARPRHPGRLRLR